MFFIVFFFDLEKELFSFIVMVFFFGYVLIYFDEDFFSENLKFEEGSGK